MAETTNSDTSQPRANVPSPEPASQAQPRPKPPPDAKPNLMGVMIQSEPPPKSKPNLMGEAIRGSDGKGDTKRQ